MNQKQCQFCVHCVPVEGQDNKGHCRRYPPEPFPVLNQGRSVLGGQERLSVPVVMSFFPVVNLDYFCGEWKGDGHED